MTVTSGRTELERGLPLMVDDCDCVRRADRRHNQRLPFSIYIEKSRKAPGRGHWELHLETQAFAPEYSAFVRCGRFSRRKIGQPDHTWDFWTNLGRFVAQPRFDCRFMPSAENNWRDLEPSCCQFAY